MDEGRQAAAAALAKELTGHALAAGKDFTDTMTEYIQKGPDGVSWLCFLGGMATSVLGLLGLINIFDAVVEPLAYLVNIYQMFFGLTACVLEAPKDWIGKSQKLKRAQEFIHEFGRFLTTMGGRGLFYLFQGSLDISLNSTISLTFPVGCYMCVLGVLCIAIQYGLKPDALFDRSAAVPTRNDDYIHVT
eukprot:TRINITY_DN64155_c0_g1_i1.p1 TRINITY_DN64155_c0_g1~~TRINITY_DN64155_c0_g1_i1.p1  ORF type:complete len:189 (-),score=32.89 TRINITY_DN64155_c0_g1_i1:30-596(-)